MKKKKDFNETMKEMDEIEKVDNTEELAEELREIYKCEFCESPCLNKWCHTKSEEE